MTKRKLFLRVAGGAVLGLAVAGFTVTAEAQVEDRRGRTVSERPRPELESQGLPAGSFRFYPRLEISETYDDNVFAVDSGESDDFVTRIRPELDLRSNWNNHALRLRGSADVGRYADSSSEDYEDYRLSANGRIDIRRDSYVYGALSFSELHEDRSSPDDANGVSPAEYREFLTTVGIFNGNVPLDVENVR